MGFVVGERAGREGDGAIQFSDKITNIISKAKRNPVVVA
jgi:hypothetical protein